MIGWITALKKIKSHMSLDFTVHTLRSPVCAVHSIMQTWPSLIKRLYNFKHFEYVPVYICLLCTLEAVGLADRIKRFDGQTPQKSWLFVLVNVKSRCSGKVYCLHGFQLWKPAERQFERLGVSLCRIWALKPLSWMKKLINDVEGDLGPTFISFTFLELSPLCLRGWWLCCRCYATIEITRIIIE